MRRAVLAPYGAIFFLQESTPACGIFNPLFESGR
ncbi:MAG: hypothetical protein KatS3mg018_1016 [Fimbriimonadales bacterium]|nr:MAG: hypothetical protein KatS3mg018_1016 [Fimbriimonadales bacterium]